ncbi:MAG: homoserine O-succinyltransferase [Deltaproteobacteria bacterium]|nr:MAG: homoserine O-succinyltransferase [Deltaproteobacteria bacterium]
MPLVNHKPLPSLTDMAEQGHAVLTLEEATHQDIRELHIGLLNMMPDAALRVTEQQFMRMVGSCNQIAQFYVHLFTVPGLQRGPQASAYIDEHYDSFDKLKAEGLDALIITGANVSNPSLEQEPFWEPLQEVIDWATEHTTSVLCSCLATHALMKHQYNMERIPLPQKRWGVYSHTIHQPNHPLLRDINTRFDVPHSRHNAITSDQFLEAGLTILVESDEGGVHIAVSPDQFRMIYFQAHPEYDSNSLLKEYKREVTRYIHGARDDYPPHPEHYFFAQAANVADEYQHQVQSALEKGQAPPPFPENELERLVDNTWGDTGKAIVNNWLGLVYKLTHIDRGKTFGPGINPKDPLKILGLDENTTL